MGRIVKAYEEKFRNILVALGARRVEQGIRLLLGRATWLSAREGVPLPRALVLVHARLLASQSRLQLHRLRPSPHPSMQVAPSEKSSESKSNATSRQLVLLCDAGLGGLARWLRASGQEAVWIQDIDDDALLREAERLHATILTTDSLLMERRVLRNGAIPAVWVSPALRMLEQLGLVFQELNLVVKPARCMVCGGELQRVEKQAVRERIPPRTYLWLDEYFECVRCGKLFWHGTHWRKIMERLDAEVRENQPVFDGHES
jgi:hypothetical protein